MKQELLSSINSRLGTTVTARPFHPVSKGLAQNREKMAKARVSEFKKLSQPIIQAFMALPAVKQYPASFVKEWVNSVVEDLTFGLERGGQAGRSGGLAGTAQEAISSLKKALSVKELKADYEHDQSFNSMQEVKKKGAKLAGDSSQKVKLLQKMGLTGVEFHALCLMIKEQIG